MPSAFGALGTNKFKAAPQLGVALLHFVAQFAAFEFGQGRFGKMTPGGVEPALELDDVAVQNLEISHLCAGFASRSARPDPDQHNSDSPQFGSKAGRSLTVVAVQTPSALTGISVGMSFANIASGTIKIYGRL